MPAVTPLHPEIAPGVVRGRWWQALPDGRVQCDLCPRHCRLHEGQRAFCYVREARDGGMALTSWGRASGFCIDPIEKKPLDHFYPGSSVLSFGTAGCNLGCKFCQNWDISKAREDRVLAASATPERVVDAALAHGAASLAFTYNDPVIFAEYAIDCAREARARGVHTVAVSAGYITPTARGEFYEHMDAANIDLKGFTEEFYRRTCAGQLAPVLDTLVWLHRETPVWLEVTTLLIPGLNDGADDVARQCDWFLEHLGPDVPLHFTAFHPDFRMTDRPHTPPATLRRARRQALDAGLRHVYTGNIRDGDGQSTYCTGCGAAVIGREGYTITAWRLDPERRCAACGTKLAGHFAPQPGTWGARRLPIAIGR